MESQNVPLEFYGKVVDQDGSPLAGAKVNVKVRHWTVMVPAPFAAAGGMIPVQRETAADGRFTIRGVAGDGFDVESIQKDGYELEMTQRSYSATGGSPAEPVVFRMWNTNIHEQLISGQKSFHITPDGRPYAIDLSRGTISNH